MRRHVFASAMAVLTAVAGFPQSKEWHSSIQVGGAAQKEGDYEKAAELYRSATQAAEKLDRRDVRRAYAWNALATVYDALGRFTDAERAYRQALKAAQEGSGKSSPTYALILGNLGSLYVELQQKGRGEKLLREALAIHYAANPPDALRTAITQDSLGEILSTSGKYQEAERLLTASLTLLKNLPNVGVERATARNGLGVVRTYQGEFREARRLFLESLEEMEKQVGPDHPLLIRMLSNLASLAGRAGELEEAGERLSRAVDIAERHLGAEHPAYGLLLGNYAAYLRQTGEKSRAKTLAAKSDEILQDSRRRNGIGAVVDITSLRDR